MRALLLFTITTACALAQPNTLTPAQVKDGWILLFDGKSLAGWAQEGPGAKWSAKDGAILAEEGGNGWLRSEGSYGDYIFQCEFRTAEKGNSGIFLRAAKEGQPHVTGYELQIWNYNEKFPTGSFVNHVSTDKGKLLGDVWNTYEVTVRGDHWVVKLNGKEVLDAHAGKTKAGHIGLQANKDKIEFRNMKLKPLR